MADWYWYEQIKAESGVKQYIAISPGRAGDFGKVVSDSRQPLPPSARPSLSAAAATDGQLIGYYNWVLATVASETSVNSFNDKNRTHSSQITGNYWPQVNHGKQR